MEHYDVIIIGTGAGGGTLAHRLAPSGKRILLLERGGYLPRELENWDSQEVFGRERYVTSERWYDKHGVAFRPHAQYVVGGNTKVYAAALLRLRDRDESDPEAGRCIRCDRFDGFPCLLDGKADAHVLCVRPAVKHPNVTLRTHARVKCLETDASGRSVSRVVVDRRGTEEAFSADVVVVSCGAANSAALLLRSASDKHRDGLANSSDVVGRHYMAHLNSAVIAISRTPNETRFQKTLGLNDYYWGAEDSDLPL